MEERKKVNKVISGEAKTRKKSGIEKVKDTFISEDLSNIRTYVISDVLVPAIKKAVDDIISNGVHMLLYGETGRSSQRSNSSYVSYNRFSERANENKAASRKTSGYAFNEFILEDRGEAEEVLNRMDELVETYGMVTVADMYDLVGITGNYTDNGYGWTSLRTAEVVRARGGGYIIKLPRAMPIK